MIFESGDPLHVGDFDSDKDISFMIHDEVAFLDLSQVKELINHLQTQVWRLEAQNGKEDV